MTKDKAAMDVEEVLNLAQAEIRVMYKRLGISGSNVLDQIDNAYTAAKDKPVQEGDPKRILLNRFGCKDEKQLFSATGIDLTYQGIIVQAMKEYAESPSPSDHIADGVDWDKILPDYREAIKNHLVDGTTAIWLFTWIQEQVKSQLKSRPEFSQGERGAG